MFDKHLSVRTVNILWRGCSLLMNYWSVSPPPPLPPHLKPSVMRYSPQVNNPTVNFITIVYTKCTVHVHCTLYSQSMKNG